jgi:hypothetical protein
MRNQITTRSFLSGIIVFLFVIVFPGFGAGNAKKPGEQPLFTWDLYWTGSIYNSMKTAEGEFPPADDLFAGGTLFNRGNLTLGLPGPDISFRFMATDKRLLPPDEENTMAGFNPGFGVYHHGSGSRFLYGAQSEYGLPARIKNVWLRSVPFIESRSPSFRDLKTEPSLRDTGETYLRLSLPYNVLPGFDAFASAALDEDLNAAYTGGVGLGGNGLDLRLEGFYTRRELPPRNASTWFSSTPPLPERDSAIYALGMIFSSSRAALAVDAAWSETFAWGRGIYANAALRLGGKPWRFSVAGDGSGGRFADRGGAAAGGGFRLAGKIENFRPRSGLFRLQGTFRSPGLDEDFNRGYFSVYFRPSAAEKREGTFPIRFTRASVSLNRDARKPERTEDTLDASVGINFRSLSGVFSCSLRGLSCLREEAGNTPLFEPVLFETLQSFKVAGELRLKLGIVELKTKLGYTARADKEPLWEPSLNCSVKPGKWGRAGLKIASADFPEKWNYTLSWRFEAKEP